MLALALAAGGRVSQDVCARVALARGGRAAGANLCRVPLVVLLIAVLTAACNSGGTPTAPSVVVTTTPPPQNTTPTPIVPAAGPLLSIVMPIDVSDIAGSAFGLLPFGYHGADHATDGHSGWDIEYRPGTLVRAAAAGVVYAIEPDTIGAGRIRVTLEHLIGAHIYRTVYANLASTNPGIVLKASVAQRQAIGTAGGVTASFGADTATYAMAHFQVDDFEVHREGPDPKAVSPEPFLNGEGRGVFDRVWALAAFAHELTEPFVAVSRDAIPRTRTWRIESGDGPAGVSFTRLSGAGADHTYFVLAQSGTAVESGAVRLRLLARPFPTIDLVTPTGPRLGIYDIVGDRMRLALGSPGAPRPTDLGSASVYRTPGP